MHVFRTFFFAAVLSFMVAGCSKKSKDGVDPSEGQTSQTQSNDSNQNSNSNSSGVTPRATSGASSTESQTSSEDTVVIPGHGALSDKAGVMKTLEMVKDQYAVTAKAVADGKSLEEFLASNPTAAHDGAFAIREDAGRVFATRNYIELSGK